MLDLPHTSPEYQQFVKYYKWMRTSLREYAKHRFPGDELKQSQLAATSLLHLDSSTVAEILSWHVSSRQDVSTGWVSTLCTGLRKQFYFAGRCFACASAPVSLLDVGVSYLPQNPVPLSLYQSLAEQVSLRRKQAGLAAVPSGHRHPSAVPSACLLLCELAHLWSKVSLVCACYLTCVPDFMSEMRGLTS